MIVAGAMAPPAHMVISAGPAPPRSSPGSAVVGSRGPGLATGGAGAVAPPVPVTPPGAAPWHPRPGDHVGPRFDRYHLAVEPALCPGGLGLGLGPQAERVDFLTGEPAALRDALGRDILARHVDVPGFGPGRARVSPGRGAQRHPAHRLDPARDPHAERVRRAPPGHHQRRLLLRT